MVSCWTVFGSLAVVTPAPAALCTMMLTECWMVANDGWNCEGCPRIGGRGPNLSPAMTRYHSTLRVGFNLDSG